MIDHRLIAIHTLHIGRNLFAALRAIVLVVVALLVFIVLPVGAFLGIIPAP